MIKVKNLKGQVGMNGSIPFLYCINCGGKYSANAGDYFIANPEYIFTCCEEPMRLVTKSVTYKEIN